MENQSTYRIRTKLGETEPINIPIKLMQEYNSFEILSLKINTDDTYRSYTSTEGIVVGRVSTANNGLGIPNVRVSIFIPKGEYNQSDEEKVLYPFSSPTDLDGDRVRYNLLPSESDVDCYQVIGTFPTKRKILDNETVCEVFEKYYKYTTVTNEAGDFMLSNIPVGKHRIHIDADLSDIGPFLSQKPYNMIENLGFEKNRFESTRQFKTSKDLDSLVQVISQNKSVHVYPYWGDATENSAEMKITRTDLTLNYEFKTQAIFIGSVITDKQSNSIRQNCTATENAGKMSDMVTGPGQIEMIRKTVDDKIEQFKVKGDALINDNGVWCYAVPMNLDYVKTDEFGNIVPTDDPNKGIPTRARVRFRITLNEMKDDKDSHKRCSYLVPNNPKTDDERFLKENEADYSFGSDTWDESFVDLLWNKVYTVKNFVPRFQKSTRPTNRKHTGIKMVNHFGDNNPFPYNSMSIKLPFVFRLICVIVNVFIILVATLNAIISIIGALPCFIAGIHIWKWHPFRKLLKFTPKCIAISPEFCDDGVNRVVTYPGCGSVFDCVWYNKTLPACTKEQRKLSLNGEEQGVCINKAGTLRNCVQNQLAQQNEATSFNFGNDWINGCLYMPLWHRKIKPKKSFFFGLFKRKAKDEWCSGEKGNKGRSLKYTQFCAHSNTNTVFAKDYRDKPIVYHTSKLTDGCGNNCHKTSRYVTMDNGVIMNRKTMFGQTVWYYKAVEVGVALDTSIAMEYLDYEGKPKFSKLLYATDIVLLGSMNDCDTNGIPKFFNYLKGSTYNMPSDILFTDTEISYKFDMEGNLLPQEVHQTSVSSGCDWGNANEYGKSDGGLFYSIGCSDIDVNAPSCINLRRICELGIGLDEIKYVENIKNEISSSTEDLDYYNEDYYLRPDGFVSYDDIIDFDYRSMFATLNGNGLKTKINSSSGVREYDFRHMYIDNFDGSLYEYMHDRTKNYDTQVNYKNNFNLETANKDYLLFRMGEKPYFYDGESIVKYDKFNNPGPHGMGNPKYIGYRFPKFRNSFYFYFGLKEGKTAIDLFNQQYNEPCSTKNEYEPSIPYETKGNSWCVKDEDTSAVDEKFNHANHDGYLRLNLEDIAAPYSLIFNSVDNADVTYSASGINEEQICFCGKDAETHGYKQEFLIYEDSSGVKSTKCYMLNNGEYNLTIADAEGNYSTVAIKISADTLQFDDVETNFQQPNDVLLQMYSTYNDIAKKGSLDGVMSEGYPEITRKDGVTTINGIITLYNIFQDGDFLNDFRIKVYTEDEDLVSFMGKDNTEAKLDVHIGSETSNPYIFPKSLSMGDGDQEVNCYVIQCPKGDVYYRVRITQLCGNEEEGWYETKNYVEKKLRVTQPTPYKLYINGIDYDIIKNFKTGWKLDTNKKMQTRDGYGKAPFTDFNINEVKGWSNIGKICPVNNKDDKFYYDWEIDKKAYGGNDLIFETDNVTGYVELTTYEKGREYFKGTDEEWNALSERVQYIKNRLTFVETIKEGLFLFCRSDMKTLVYQVVTDDNPYDLWSMYNPEIVYQEEVEEGEEPEEGDEVEEESADYGEIHFSENKGDGTHLDYKYIGTNENMIDDIKIPTLTYADSKLYGNHTGRGLCFGQDNAAQEYQGSSKYVNIKPPYLVACVNSMAISKPFGMSSSDFFAKHKNEAGIEQYGFGNVSGNNGYINHKNVEFFGVHIIDKIMDCNFVCWSYINDIHLFLNNFSYDDRVFNEGGKYCTYIQRNIKNTNGLASFEIINGKTNDFGYIEDFNERLVYDENVIIKTFNGCTEYDIPTRRCVLLGKPVNNEWVYNGNLNQGTQVKLRSGLPVKTGYYECEGKVVYVVKTKNDEDIFESKVDKLILKSYSELMYNFTEKKIGDKYVYSLEKETIVKDEKGNNIPKGFYRENGNIIEINDGDVNSFVGDVIDEISYGWSYETPEDGNMEGVNVTYSNGRKIIDGYYVFNNVAFIVQYSVITKEMACYKYGKWKMDYSDEAVQPFHHKLDLTHRIMIKTNNSSSETIELGLGEYVVQDYGGKYYFISVNDKSVINSKEEITIEEIDCAWKYVFPLAIGSKITTNADKIVSKGTYIINDRIVEVEHIDEKEEGKLVKKSVIKSIDKFDYEIKQVNNELVYESPLMVGSEIKKNNGDSVSGKTYILHNLIITVGENSKVSTIENNTINPESVQQEMIIDNKNNVKYSDGSEVKDGVYTCGSEVWIISDEKLEERKKMPYANYKYTTKSEDNQYVLVPNYTGTFKFTDLEENCSVENVLYGGMEIEFKSSLSNAEENKNILTVGCKNPLIVDYYLYNANTRYYPMNKFEYDGEEWSLDCNENINAWDGTEINAQQIFNKNTTATELSFYEDKNVKQNMPGVFENLSPAPYFVVARTSNGCCTMSNVYDFTTINYYVGIVDYGFKKFLRIGLYDVIKSDKTPNNYYLTRYNFNGSFKCDGYGTRNIEYIVNYGETATNFLSGITGEDDDKWIENFLNIAKIGQSAIYDKNMKVYTKETPDVEEITEDVFLDKKNVNEDYDKEYYVGAWDALEMPKGLVNGNKLLDDEGKEMVMGIYIVEDHDKNDNVVYREVEINSASSINGVKNLDYNPEEYIEYGKWDTNNDVRLAWDKKYEFMDKKYKISPNVQYCHQLEEDETIYQVIKVETNKDDYKIKITNSNTPTGNYIYYGYYIVKWVYTWVNGIDTETETIRKYIHYRPTYNVYSSQVKSEKITQVPYFINYKEFKIESNTPISTVSNPILTITDEMGLKHTCKYEIKNTEEDWIDLIVGANRYWYT